MSISTDEAITDINRLINTVVTAGAAALLDGVVPTIYWQDKEQPGTPDRSKIWMRVSHMGLSRPQASLSNDVFVPGVKRFTATGITYVQIFMPKSVVNADSKLRLLGELIWRAIASKATPNRVILRNARVSPLPPEEFYYRSNVVTEHEYDTLA